MSYTSVARSVAEVKRVNGCRQTDNECGFDEERQRQIEEDVTGAITRKKKLQRDLINFVSVTHKQIKGY